MPDKKRDPEFEALQSVHAALKPLAAEERTRVLTSVYALLGIRGPDPTPAAAPPSRPAAPSTADAPAAGIPSRSQARPLSINELVQEKSPGTNAQRIALFAYYRDKHEGISRFTRDDLKAYFAKAKEQPPRNYDRDFVEAVKRGWIHEDGAESYVTSKGIEVVESGFAGERKYTKRAGPTRKVGKSASGTKSRAKRQRKTRGSRK
jgi:hypothetical protein